MPDLMFAKIVSTPKLDSWSQVYNAGKLFAVLSLEKEIVSTDAPDFLNILGKDLLAKLEEEFFTLNYKNIDSIKKAFSNAFLNIQNDVKYSFAAGFFVDNALYLFTIGKGTIFIKRGLKIAKSPDENPKTIISFSGVLKNNDLIILATNILADIINAELFSSLDNLTPSEIAETITAKIQEKEDGKTAAIIIQYSEPKSQEIPVAVKEKKTKEVKNYVSLFKKYLPINKIKFNHQSKVMLTLVAIILTIFISTVYFGIKKQESAKVKAIFDKTYPEAEKKYSEGNSLLDLNKNIAYQNFVEAKKILDDSKSKFPKNSKEEKQILELLGKVNNAVSDNSPEKIAKSEDKTKITISIENGSGQEGVAGKAADFLKTKGYNVLSTANADNYKYVGVTIKVKSSTSAYLDILKKDLSEKYTVTETSSNLPKNSTSDVLVIIGK